jgi:hypothetical protein
MVDVRTSPNRYKTAVHGLRKLPAMNTASNRTSAKTAQNSAEETTASRMRSEARGKELKRTEEIDRQRAVTDDDDVYADMPCTD